MEYKHPTQLLSATLTEQEVHYSLQVLNEQRLNEGAELNALITQLCERFNTQHCYPFMGGRSSLLAIMKALQLKEDDRILVPAFTCQAVCNSMEYHHPHVTYVDIEDETYGMDADALESIIEPNCKVLFLQYSFGLVCRDLERLLAIAKRHNLIVIEDCAHALGAQYKGKEVGNFGDFAFFSSERSKLINTIHGGFAICHNSSYAEALAQVHLEALYPPQTFQQRLLETLIDNYSRYCLLESSSVSNKNLIPQMFEEELQGNVVAHYHYKMPNTVAKIMLLQLEGLEERAAVRAHNAEYWEAIALNRGWKTPKVLEGSKSAWLRYPVVADESIKQSVIDNTSTLPKELNTTIGVWFMSAAHPSPIELPHCPVGTRIANSIINFPTY